MRAFYHDNDLTRDYREDHDSGKPVSEEQLFKLGLLYYNIKTIDEVNTIAQERDYKNRDQVEISPNSFPPDVLKTKLDSFYAEHIHEDEEIRYVIDGEGFFDIRSAQDEWIRIKVFANDLIILPPGIYHRFTLSTKNFIKAIRLFKDEPKWIPLTRPVDENQYRQQYLKSINV
ncbi:Acireductone dioxygenase [Wickerhamomyces ciferrii]|uniref:Acireductone dioxygenase n=1 Tax=Wickerhamomyces ciferrii (strain ATCC 14091 / BCRC 22168 / CBS 111 / JCM 3599 / NBRC 0793 / NRRL Y-1031 F-60-10) TaxID=1206466 RepID=K0K7X1_WICCF|nr:Acireductone dioxygenase [Wickerhamomyces ciferrii]CCH40915.1 Acireductone dioxygenase [Wickerhamomyces ciferrii]